MSGRANVEHIALKTDKNTGACLPSSAPNTPPVKYNNPVALWMDSTFLGGVESPEALPAYAATVTMRCETSDQFVEMLRQLTARYGLELVTNDLPPPLRLFLPYWQSYYLSRHYPSHPYP